MSYKNKYSVKHPNWGAEKIYYLSHNVYVKKYHLVARVLKFIGTMIFRSYIDPQAKIGKRLELAHGGFGVVINRDTEIGDDAIIFHNVTIGNGGVRVGDCVYIGTGVTIIGPCVIGDNVVIGANTFVDFDISHNSVVVGVKGKVKS